MKASAGAAAHLPVARVVNIAVTIDLLKKKESGSTVPPGSQGFDLPARPQRRSRHCDRRRRKRNETPGEEEV